MKNFRSSLGPVMKGVSSVSCGREHTAAITTNGDLYMWGNNKDGQIGNGSTANVLTPVLIMKGVVRVSCGWNSTAAITKRGELYMWGKLSDVIGDSVGTAILKPTLIEIPK